MKYGYALLIALMLCVGTAAAQSENPARNMSLFGHLNPVEGQGLHSSLWGYTAPDGREYALFASQIGTHVIDITEQPIREVDFVPGPKTPWREFKTYKQYAYVSVEWRDSGAGLQILDLSYLPDSVSLVRTDTTNFLSAHTIYIRDHYLYAMGTRAEAEANGGAVIMDLEPDPLHPQKVGVVDPYYFHDAFVRNDTLLGAAVYGPGCDIYDISDKENPVHLATITYPNSGTHNAELTDDGNYVVTSDEINFTPKTMKVWDIRDLDNIQLVAEFTPDLRDIVHNVRMHGRYAYVAWYTAGVRIIDMIDPVHPREVGYYDTYPGESGGFDGVWEVYGHFPSGKIIASDRNTGLYVLEFNGAVAGSVSGTVRDSETNAPLPGVSFYVPEYDTWYTSDAVGRYYIGGVEGDDVTVVTEHYPYAGTTFSETLNGDITQDIFLDPLDMYSVVLKARDVHGDFIEDFSYATLPYIKSTRASGESATIMLPRDSTYVINIGKWGYELVREEVTVTQEGQEVIVLFRRHYQDDATLDLGWSYEDPEDNAVTGRWVRTIPYLGFPEADWIHPPFEPAGSGGYVFMTGKPPLFAPPQSGDVNQGKTTLISPLMDLSDHKDPAIFFDLWFVHYLQDTVRDSLVVELSGDDGNTWVEAYNEIGGKAGWSRKVIFPAEKLPIPLSEEVRVRFRVSDSTGDVLILAAIDNFDVYNRLLVDAPREAEGSHAGEAVRVTVLPNPAAAEARITVSNLAPHTPVRVELYDEKGDLAEIAYQGIQSAGTLDIPIGEDIAAGWYLVRVTDGRHTLATHQMVLLR